MSNTVILTGSQGFLGSFLCAELLSSGYTVIGYDNYSKYGRVVRPHDNHPNFELIEMDLAKSEPDFSYHRPDFIIAGAAMIGGISYFHRYAYDLLATNERIMANTFDAAIKCRKFGTGIPKRVIVISSSMVFEGADEYYSDHTSTSEQANCCYQSCFDKTNVWPTREGMEKQFCPPLSTYGWQKLSTEYFARGAYEQYKLPYTIVRPFNCVGVGEGEALGSEEVMSGNINLMLSHVLPDFVNKCLKGQDPLHILGDGNQIRCYTNGVDVARGIRLAMESPNGLNNDFNISTSRATSVLELAELVWSKINPTKPFRYVSEKPYEYDVQKRIPDVRKAKELLGFEAQVSLEKSINQVIEWMKENGRREEKN